MSDTVICKGESPLLAELNVKLFFIVWNINKLNSNLNNLSKDYTFRVLIKDKILGQFDC